MNEEQLHAIMAAIIYAGTGELIEDKTTPEQLRLHMGPYRREKERARAAIRVAWVILNELKPESEEEEDEKEGEDESEGNGHGPSAGNVP